MSLLITFMYSFKFKDLICNSPFSLFCDFLRQLREFGALSSWHCQTDKLPILVIFFHGRGGGGVWLEMVSEVPYWLHMGVKEKHFYFYVNNSMQVFIALDMIYFFYLVVWLQCQRSRRPGQLLQHLAHHQLSLAQLHPQTHAQCVRLNR